MVDLQFQFLIVFKLNNLAQETFIHEPLYHTTIVMLVFSYHCNLYILTFSPLNSQLKNHWLLSIHFKSLLDLTEQIHSRREDSPVEFQS